jgi:hypothetical protein
VSDNRPPVYFEPPNIIFRASSISSCPIRLAHIALGRVEEYPQQVMDAFSAGHVFEEILIARLQAETGCQIINRQAVAEYSPFASCIIRGHTDGEIGSEVTNEFERYGLASSLSVARFNSYANCLFEAKSAAPSSFEKFKTYGLEKYPGYKKQLAIYCRALSYKGAVIFFINKETHEIHAKYFSPFDACNMELADEISNTCLRTIQEIGNIKKGEPSLCNEFKNQTFACPFPDLHSGEDAKTIDDVKLEVLLDDLQQINAQIAEMEERKKHIKAICENKFLAEKVGKAFCGRHTIQYQERDSVDTTAIRREHPELIEWEKQYRKTSRYLRIDSKRS